MSKEKPPFAGDRFPVRIISHAVSLYYRFSPSYRDMEMIWWTDQAEGLRGRIDRSEQFKWFAPYVDGPPRNM